jgi:hypothetical protein
MTTVWFFVYKINPHTSEALWTEIQNVILEVTKDELHVMHGFQ